MVLMTATTLASCNNSTSAQPEAVPVQLDDEESWSLVDFGGEIIAKNAFDNTPSYVYNGTFVVKEEDGLYVHHISDPKKALNSEPFLQLTNFASGHAFGVRPGTGILLVNTDGEVIKQLSDDIATVYVPVPLGALDFLPYKDTDEKPDTSKPRATSPSRPNGTQPCRSRKALLWYLTMTTDILASTPTAKKFSHYEKEKVWSYPYS